MSFSKSFFALVGAFTCSVLVWEGGKYCLREIKKEFQKNPFTPDQVTDGVAVVDLTDYDPRAGIIQRFDQLFAMAEDLSEFSVQNFETREEFSAILHEIKQKCVGADARAIRFETRRNTKVLLCAMEGELAFTLFRFEDGQFNVIPGNPDVNPISFGPDYLDEDSVLSLSAISLQMSALLLALSGNEGDCNIDLTDKVTQGIVNQFDALWNLQNPANDEMNAVVKDATSDGVNTLTCRVEGRDIPSVSISMNGRYMTIAGIPLDLIDRQQRIVVALSLADLNEALSKSV